MFESQFIRNGDIPLLAVPKPAVNAKSWFHQDNRAIIKCSNAWEMVYLWHCIWKMMGSCWYLIISQTSIDKV